MKKTTLILLIIILILSYSNQIAFAESKDERTVYLTFDDGPSANTAKVLDILKEYNVKATFFVVKRENYESLYRRILREGHSLGGHSASHNYQQIYSDSKCYFKDLNELKHYVYKLTGYNFQIIRFPGGSNNTISRRYARKDIMTQLTEEAISYGYTYYDWNVDARDSYKPLYSSEKISEGVIQQCLYFKKAMVLMHDSPNKINTPDSLPLIITTLRSKGYVFRRITDDTPIIIFD